MKIEKLTENKLKVTLTLKDMQKWNISYENLLPDHPDTNEFFWDIIHRATEETGMKFENCRLIIEAMQEDENTYVMIITKKGLSEKRPVRYKFYKKQGMKRSPDSFLVYSFKEIDDISVFAKNNLYYCFLFDGRNTLYRDSEGLKLVITLSPELKEYALALGDRICEYANLEHCSYLYSSYLDEHARVIIKNNALKTIYYKI